MDKGKKFCTDGFYASINFEGKYVSLWPDHLFLIAEITRVQQKKFGTTAISRKRIIWWAQHNTKMKEEIMNIWPQQSMINI